MMPSPLSALHDALVCGRLSCTELTAAYLDAAGRDNPRLNAYITLTPGEAMDTARRVDQKRAAGETLRPLEGIPMALKDNLSTKGIRTTCASRMLEEYRPVYDAAAWEILKRENAVLLGKTNMDEFAMGSTGETSRFGAAGHPSAPGYVPGGSSSGTASAVGGGLAAYGLGTDTGGSVRLPAAFCGLTGLKPTYGAVSRTGLIAYASSLDVIGPLTVTAADAALVFDAIAVPDDRDATCTGRRGPSASASLGQEDLRGLRIGSLTARLDGLQPEVEQALEQAAAVFRGMGAETVELPLPELGSALSAYYILASAEASSNLARYDGIRTGPVPADGGIRRARSEGFGREVQRRILLGTYVLSAGYADAYYKRAQTLRRGLIRWFEDVFSSCDLLLMPTAPSTAFPCGSAMSPADLYRTDLCTAPASLAGLPALSVPCGFDKKGLPIGMQLIGPAFSEARLLGAAHRFERETNGAFLCRAIQGVTI